MKGVLCMFVLQALLIVTASPQGHRMRIFFPESTEREDSSGKLSNLVHKPHKPLPESCGDPLTVGAQPWIARLLYQRESGEQVECLGVLINDRYIITIADCVSSERTISKILLGEGRWHPRGRATENSLASCSKPPLQVGVESIRSTAEGIGLIRIDQTIDFSSDKNCNIQPICLPPEDFVLQESLIHGSLVGAGFQAPTSESVSENVLQSFGIPSIVSEKCSEKFGEKYSSDKHICGSDECLLPGSPLIWPGTVMKIVGLASLGDSSCKPGRFPAAYISVAFHRDWIVEGLLP